MNTTSVDSPTRSASDNKDEVGKEAKEAAETIHSEAKSVAREVKQAGESEARQGFADGRDEATRHVGSLADAVDSAADTLDRQDHPLGEYARDAAKRLSTLADTIGGKSLEEVADDTRRLARDNPAMFLVGSVVLGVAAARFFSASDRRDESDYADSNTQHYRGVQGLPSETVNATVQSRSDVTTVRGASDNSEVPA